MNLRFQPSKTRVFMPRTTGSATKSILRSLADANIVPPGGQDVEGLTVLGIPMGTPNYICQQLDQEAERYTTRLAELSKECTRQQLFKVLQQASSLFQHYLATLQPDLTADFAKSIDDANWSTFRQAFLDKVPLTIQDINYVRDRAILPLRHQGLGILALEERIYTANYIACTSIATSKNTLEKNT